MEVPFFFALFFFSCRISIVRLCLEPEHVRRRASECGGRSRRAACEKPDRPLWSLDGGRVDQACLLCSRVHGALRLGNKIAYGWTKPRPQLVASSVDRAHSGKRGWRDGRRIGAAARPPKLKESERSDGYGDKSEWRERRRRNETAPRPFSHNADSQPHNVLNKIALWSSMLEQFLSRCLQQTICTYDLQNRMLRHNLKKME